MVELWRLLTMLSQEQDPSWLIYDEFINSEHLGLELDLPLDFEEGGLFPGPPPLPPWEEGCRDIQLTSCPFSSHFQVHSWD